MGELSDYLAQHDENFSKARLPALYSDFRPQRTLNPDGYRANIAAWKHALSRLAADGRLSRQGSKSSALILGLDNSLLHSLETKNFGQPLALGAAIRETIAERGLVPLQHFLKSPQSVYYHGWSELPWNVVGWTLRQFGLGDTGRGEDKLPTGRFVIMENVERAGRAVEDQIATKSSKFDRIFTKAQFQQQFATGLVNEQERLSETDLDVLLRFLARDRGVIEYDGRTIRFKGTGEQQDGITEADTTIASLKELTANLTRQVDLLNTRIEELNEAAKNAVVRKNRVSALAALKSKKLAETSLASRYATLAQLEEVAARIEQASDQVQLVQVMESSTGVLRNLNERVGGADKVDGVMGRLREQMSDTEEVAAILAEPGAAAAAVDEGEIDDELAAMERQEKEKEEKAKQEKEEARQVEEAKEARKKLENLPQVPEEEEMRREKEKPSTPTTETGIESLSIKEAPLAN